MRENAVFVIRAQCRKPFRGGLLTEIDAFFRKTGKVIIALTVKEILEEQIAKKLA